MSNQQNASGDVLGGPRSLRQVREGQGLTQFQLAGKSGVSLSTIVNVEAQRQDIRISLAMRLVEALGVTLADIAWPTEGQLKLRRPKGHAA
jgi:DNA-binding XRE family transcriptional regulator